MPWWSNSPIRNDNKESSAPWHSCPDSDFRLRLCTADFKDLKRLILQDSNILWTISSLRRQGCIVIALCFGKSLIWLISSTFFDYVLAGRIVFVIYLARLYATVILTSRCNDADTWALDRSARSIFWRLSPKVNKSLSLTTETLASPLQPSFYLVDRYIQPSKQYFLHSTFWG